MTASMRTLVLTCDPALPPVSGGDLRNYQNARIMAQLGEVLLISVRAEFRPMPAGGAIRTAVLDDGGTHRAAPVSRWRTSKETRISKPALAKLLRLAGEFAPDTIIVEGIQMIAALKHLRPFARLLVLDMHNIESDLAAQLHPPVQTLAERLLPSLWSDPYRIGMQERRALNIVDRVWVCSQADLQRLNSRFAPQVPVDVVPNGIPRFEKMPGTLPSLPGKENGWPVMLMIGHLGYEPNVAASIRLATEILPRVRQSLGAARLVLAGRNPAHEVRRLAELPAVELVVEPEDTEPLLARSHISVVPLSAGGGTRIKTLEAMAWGVPVVASSLAVEGQGFRDGEDIAIAETDDMFAGAIIDLCRSPERIERQRSLARERTLHRFGPRAIEDAIHQGLTGPGTQRGRLHEGNSE